MAKVFWIAAAASVLTAGFALTEATAQANDEVREKLYVTCSSAGGYVECETGVTVENVEIAQQKSAQQCVFGQTWGYHGSRIWVNHGCSADFSFEDANAPVPTPPPAPTPRPPRPINSVDCRWNNYNWQPWYAVTGTFIGRPAHGFQAPQDCQYTVSRSRRNAVCNWNGIGFTSYDIETNAEVVVATYANIDSCYAAIR